MSNELQVAPAVEMQTLVSTDTGENSALLDSAKFGQIQRAANLMSNSTLVPDHFRNNIPNCFIAIEMASRLGVDPFMFMQKCYVIGKKPGLEAQLIIAIANARGPFRSCINYRVSDDRQSCTAYATLRETGEEVSSTVDMKMVRKFGWDSKKDSMWTKMPEQMLKYRSAVFLIRTIAPEVIMGLYSREELQEIDQPHQSGLQALIEGPAMDVATEPEEPEEAATQEIVGTSCYSMHEQALRDAPNQESVLIAFDVAAHDPDIDDGQKKTLMALSEKLYESMN